MNSRKKMRMGFLCLIGAIGLWSTVEVVSRSVLTEVEPVQLAWARFLVGGLFLGALLPMELRKRQIKLDRRIVWFCIWVSIPGVLVSNIALQFSLKYAGAAVVATIYGAAPLFALGLSRIMLGDPMTLPRIAGLCSGFLGIATLSLGRPSVTFSLLGVACALLATASFSFWTVCVKKYAGVFAGLPVTVLCFAFGVFFMTPLVGLESGGFDLTPLAHNAVPVLYLAIGGTGLAYWLYCMGLEHVDATRAMSVILLKPPTAALLAALFLGEPITWNLLAAMALIAAALFGVFFWDPRRRASQRRAKTEGT